MFLECCHENENLLGVKQIFIKCKLDRISTLGYKSQYYKATGTDSMPFKFGHNIGIWEKFMLMLGQRRILKFPIYTVCNSRKKSIFMLLPSINRKLIIYMTLCHTGGR